MIIHLMCGRGRISEICLHWYVLTLSSWLSFFDLSTCAFCFSRARSDGVGKSSLVSTFVSRHFSEVVPGVMTRVRLPPDPSSNNCITTIVDSRGADASLASAAVARGLLPADHASSASLAELGKSTGGGSSGETSSAGTDGAVAASSLDRYGASSMRSEQPESSAIGIGGTTASSALLAGGMGDIDCIVLVYDLDRVETFYRLENHWLPLIERCFSGKVRHIMKSDIHRGILCALTLISLPSLPYQSRA